LLFSYDIFTQQEGDRIIAVIGNGVILESDLNNQLFLYARQNNLRDINDKIIQQVFQEMVAEKLILAKADQDSVYVTEDEVQKQLEYRIKSLVEQYGSEKNVEEVYGLTISRIKSFLKDDIRKQIKIERMKRMRFGEGILVSKRDVEEFFQNYKDSLPKVPETFELLQVSRKVKITDEAKINAKQKALSLLDSIKSGTDFSDIAKRYSEDTASAKTGGDLGKIKKGILVKEFEEAAFLLEQGQVSEPVETIFGYHIIKVTDKSGNQIRVSHILVRYPRFESADFEAIAFLKDIKSKSHLNEKLFKEAAFLYNEENKSDSGYVGKVSVENLDSTQAASIKNLKTGEISEPIRIGSDLDYAYYIFMLKSRIPEHDASMTEDYTLLERLTRKNKEAKELNDWIEELKKSIYVDIKI
jgi:peptidyl-prolyl cis-trans isomerase SurA